MKQNPVAVLAIAVLSSFLQLSLAFDSSLVSRRFVGSSPRRPFNDRTPRHQAAKGFGSNRAAPQKSKTSLQKAALKNVQKKYGGTTAQDVALGTEKEIQNAMEALPPHLKLATHLYQKLQGWNAHLESLSILEQVNIPVQDMEGAQRARDELEGLYKEHGITENDIHNVFQKLTWDASADAKAARALTGTMPKDIADSVQKACDIIAEAIGKEGRCLDVGCGFGVLVPFLRQSGVTSKQIVGLDLSTEMIRNAKEQHPSVQFEACDFLSYNDEEGFDGIVFCAALHDMPDRMAVLKKAALLLRPGGKLVLAHPQGTAHVLRQIRSNPILVKRGLPSADELQSLDLGLRLVVAPVSEAQVGYLAVLEKDR
jgi:2-polyprenyl-3-methyl-5-hydroxy-6-metoxy-1,4-benzoquinol methylase